MRNFNIVTDSSSELAKFKEVFVEFCLELGFNFKVDIKTTEKLMLLQTSPTLHCFRYIINGHSLETKITGHAL